MFPTNLLEEYTKTKLLGPGHGSLPTDRLQDNGTSRTGDVEFLWPSSFLSAACPSKPNGRSPAQAGLQPRGKRLEHCCCLKSHHLHEVVATWCEVWHLLEKRFRPSGEVLIPDSQLKLVQQVFNCNIRTRMLQEAVQGRARWGKSCSVHDIRFIRLVF